MDKKELFIQEVEALLTNSEKELSADAAIYFEGLKQGNDSANKPKFTENGKLILDFMKEQQESYKNLFKAKDIGEGIGVTSRGVSGALRKLVTDGYAEKLGSNPVVYRITDLGVEVDTNEE